MIEGVVDVSGSTVKVDHSDRLHNLYQLARRAKDDNNNEYAAKYYDMILVEDPTSWEAAFYLVYCNAMRCSIAQIKSAGNSVSNCIDTVLSLIRDHVQSEDEQDKAVSEVAMKCKHLSTLLYTAATKHFNGISEHIQGNYLQELVDNCSSARNIMYTLGNQIEAIFAGHETLHLTAADAWKDGIEKHRKMMTHFADKDSNQKLILEYAAKIQKYDQSYQSPEINTGSCYVATCVCGSYDCPQVWTLRRYRDFHLAKTWHGRMFIHTYYAASPSIVNRFGHTRFFRKLWRWALDRLVQRLNANGYKNTPYEDVHW